jgi:hypothetical protein
VTRQHNDKHIKSGGSVAGGSVEGIATGRLPCANVAMSARSLEGHIPCRRGSLRCHVVYSSRRSFEMSSSACCSSMFTFRFLSFCKEIRFSEHHLSYSLYLGCVLVLFSPSQTTSLFCISHTIQYLNPKLCSSPKHLR